MKSFTTLFLIICSGLLGSAHAQQIYKVIDEDGNVSYTSTKPEDNKAVETITPPREPTPEEVEAAIARQADFTRELEERRAKQEQADAPQKFSQQSDSVKRHNKYKNDDQTMVLPLDTVRPGLKAVPPRPTIPVPAPPPAVPF